MIDDQAGCDEEDSEDSMEDLTIAERAIRLKERVEALATDDLFLDDKDDSATTDEYSNEEFDDLDLLGSPNRAGRLARTDSATRPIKPKPVPRAQSLPPRVSPSRVSLFASESEGSEETEPSDSDESPRAKQKRLSAKAKGAKKLKKKASKRKPALWRRIGESANNYDDPEFDPIRYGFYFASNGRDLTESMWRLTIAWFEKEAHTYSAGFERGDDEENLHAQGQGSIRMPDSKVGRAACKARFKNDLGIEVGSGFKIQFKSVVSDQSPEKMNAYVRKQRAKPWFLFSSKDVNGEAFTDEYNDLCDARYAVECRNYTHKKLVLTRSGLYKLAEAFKLKHEEEYPEKCDMELPSFAHHLLWMIHSGRYTFSPEFLARGYRFDRLAAEKMWRLICVPEETQFADVCAAVFVNNPPITDRVEANGIWASQPVPESHAFPHMVDVSQQRYQFDINGNQIDLNGDPVTQTAPAPSNTTEPAPESPTSEMQLSTATGDSAILNALTNLQVQEQRRQPRTTMNPSHPYSHPDD